MRCPGHIKLVLCQIVLQYGPAFGSLVPMLSKNPNRANGVVSTKSVAAKTVAQPTPQQLSEMLLKANDRIAALEARLQALEAHFYVAPNGDVEISSATAVRITAGAKIDIVCDHAVEIQGAQSVKLRDQNGNQVRFASDGITEQAAARHVVTAGQMEASAGMLSVNSGMSKFSGVVKCDTIIANSVVGSSYTPGVGNIW